ncbi:RNA-directed DNA polymerase [Vibrio parahaemolyticus]|nr:RNA-directed DNA polymerase [Vibrio parahaemolyticus]EHR6686488.1 RNA-directed DNA polymerase [Vibrio parahaemolyticus]EHV9709229.1 RNA-directed DNA polymerase [Vibrio parahaemolyticus]EIV8488346.1 RNA-directed DNA polymerase [Vibrio parahaemolyticus]
MSRTKKLIQYGYLPIQLPPSFNTRSFAENYTKFESKWNSQKTPKTRSEKYSVARSSYYRRVTSILNPIGFYYISKEISKHWAKIERHYRKSNISLSKPRINPSLRAIEISKFNELYEAKIERSSGYKFALITDITSFFPTIYTHSIPWALHTKPIAKKNTTHTDEYFGNLIDAKSMSLQDGQTMGIPIGPDTSHIISEIISVSIDKDLNDVLGYWPAGFRYVDDYFLFFNTREEAERVLASLTKIVSNYELQLNPSKTKIIEVRDLVEESWKYSIKKLRISDKKKQQRDDIHNYFECVFSLESKFKDESLVKYALKQLSSSIIKKSNWSIFESYLLKCGYGFPNTLQIIVTILSTYKQFDYNLNQKALERFCGNLIETHAISDHHGEVSWLLWLCKEINVPLRREVIREVEGMSSGVCKLMVIDLYESGVIKHNLKSETLRLLASKESLYSSDWLISYEAGRRFWLKNADDKFIKDDYFFSALLKNSVSFYDESAKCNPIFNFKTTTLSQNLIDQLFDSDDDIHSYFEFDEMDEEYFDSSSSSDAYDYDEDDWFSGEF